MSRVYESPEQFLINRPPETKKAYGNALLQFSRFVFATDDLTELGEYVKKPNRTKILTDLLKYSESLKERGLSPATRKIYTACIRTFLNNNEIVFSKSQMSRIRVRNKTPTDDIAFTPDNAKMVYERLSIPTRAVFLFLLSSGARVNECLNVTEKDIDWNHQPCKVKLRITKTETERHVFISDECRDFLKNVWLPRRTDYMVSAKNRNKGLVNQSPKDGVARNARKRPAIETDHRLFPMEVSTFRESLMRAINNAGLGERNGLDRHKLHVHSARKFFRNQCGRWGSIDTAEHLMGHAPGMTAAYRKPDDEQLIEDYRTAMPHLTIGLSHEARVAIQTRDSNAVAVVSLQSENALLRGRLEKIEAELFSKELVDIREKGKHLP